MHSETRLFTFTFQLHPLCVLDFGQGVELSKPHVPSLQNGLIATLHRVATTEGV